MDTSTVIVALPAVDDKVYRISSEKVPHLTLCFLGDQSSSPELENMIRYVQHAAQELSPFGLTVDHRGTLGPDDADVLFFEDNPYDGKRIKEFRHYLLLNDAIARAYNDQEQYPEWTPHLTLGYPATPAHEDTSDYPGIHYVQFDRIAVWTGDSEGPEFRLKYDDYGMVDSMAMSTGDLGALAAATIFGKAEDPNALKQYGKKGMKWGVRNDPGHEGQAVKTKKLDKLDAKWEKSVYTTAGAVKVHNAMAEHFNSKIEAVNAKHPDADYRKGEDTPEWKAYMADVNTLQSESYSHAVSTVHGSSPSGKKKAEYYNDGKGNERIVIHSAHLAHADTPDAEPDLILIAKTDDQGRLLELNTAELEGVAHTEIGGAEAFFAHYGVKGMRWGVSKDRATSKGGASSGPTAVVVNQKKPGTFAKTSGGQGHPLHEDAANALVARQKAKASTTDALSNQELRAAVERMQLEQKYSQLSFSNDRRSAGARFLAGFFGKPKPTKYVDMQEDAGAKTADAVGKVMDARAKARQTA